MGRTKVRGRSEAASGQPRFPYCTAPNSLRRFLTLVPDKPKPPKVTVKTLKAWGFTSSNDFSILRVLKGLDLLSSSGEPTQHYVAFMKRDAGPAALGTRLRETYAELFQNVAHPERTSNEDLRNFFNIHSGGGERTIRLQIETFKALAAHATFGAGDTLGEEAPPDGPADSGGGPGTGPAVRIDLHIHLPENKTKADYDAILESIANHLYRRRKP
jgi:hypothetical protein